MSDGDATDVPAPDRPPVFDRLRKKKPVTRIVSVCLDPDLAEAVFDAEQAVMQAEEKVKGSPGDGIFVRELDDARAQVDAAREAAAPAMAEFTFRGVGRPAFEELLDRHAPSKPQLDDAKKRGLALPEYDPDTFQPALVQASCRSVKFADGEELPGLTDEQIKEIWHNAGWNQAELLHLWLAALACNQTARIVDLGKG